MKIKYILIVSLLLAILTIGAVSASDDVNNLTAMDDAVVTSTNDVEGTVSQVEDSDSVAGDNSGDEVLSGEQAVNYGPILPKDIRVGDEWGEEYDRVTYVGVRFYEQEISGNVEFYVDGELKSTQPAVSYYYHYDDTGVHFDLLENNIGAGLHNITIKYLGDDNYAPFELNHKVELYYMKAAVPETVKDDSYGERFQIMFALDATGYLDLFLDDKFVATYDVNYDRYDEDENWYTPWLSIRPSDYVSFGDHKYTAKYYGGNYENKTVNGSFKLDYVFEVDCYDAPYYGENLNFYISLPKGATGNITFSVNGKTYNIETEGSTSIFYVFEDVSYGESEYVFSYGDDKFPKKDVVLKFNATGRISSIYDDINYLSDDGNITLILPEDADGNLTVYKFVYNPVSGDDDEIEIATAKLVNGKASVSLSDLNIGHYNIISRYVGEDYEAEPERSWFYVVPNVKSPKGIWNESTDEHQITVTSPSDVDANLTIEIWTSTLDRYDYDFEHRLVEQIYSADAKGTVSATIPTLDVGVYSIYVVYQKDGGTLSSKSYKLVVSDANPDWTMKVDVPKEIVKGDEAYSAFSFWPENLPSREDQVILSVYIDGEYFTATNFENWIESDCNLARLSLGTHTWKATYSGSYYFNDASAEGTFDVVWITIPEEVIDGVTRAECYFDEDAAGFISLSIDGKDYATEFLKDGYASFKLSNFTFGEHTYEFIYSGDANHAKLTKTGSFNNTMYFEMDDWLDYKGKSGYMESYPVSFELPSDATGTITLTVGDKVYTQDVVNGTASFEIKDLNIGSHKLVAVYSGDKKYPKKEISKEFEITGYKIFFEYEDDWETFENLVSVSIALPGDATGSLVLYNQNGYDEETWEYLWEEFKRVDVANGKAKIIFSELKLPFGNYNFKVVYEGDESYGVSEDYIYGYLGPTIKVTDFVNIGEVAAIDIDLGDATGTIVICINGEEFKTVEIENGKVHVDVPSDKLTKEENIVTFYYDGEGLEDNPFGYYDDDEFVPEEYYIYVKFKELDIPDDFAADGTGNLTLELPEGSKGNVTVYVDDKKVSTTPVTGGPNTIPVSDLPTGNHNVRVEYEDENGNKYSTSKDVNVPNPEPKMDIITPTDSTNPEFSINLPEDATGSLIVTVDGKNYAADLVNGKATVSVPDLSNGNHNVTVKYTGDKNYSGFVKNTNVVVNMTSKEDIAPEPEKKDDVTPEPKKKADKITLKLAKVKKVKRSAKKLVIKATLKINGKAVKGKKLKFKFNKKTYTAKTNKKGVAKITIKKKVLKKLKVGKKVKIQVSYGKKTAKINVKVKR